MSEHLGECVVWQWIGLVFGIDELLDGSFDVSHADVVAVFACGGGEEPLERHDAIVGLHPFAGADAADGGDMQRCASSHVVECHRAQQRLVACLEVWPLQLYDGFHGGGEVASPLLYGFDETSGFVHALADVCQSFSL